MASWATVAAAPPKGDNAVKDVGDVVVSTAAAPAATSPGGASGAPAGGLAVQVDGGSAEAGGGGRASEGPGGVGGDAGGGVGGEGAPSAAGGGVVGGDAAVAGDDAAAHKAAAGGASPGRKTRGKGRKGGGGRGGRRGGGRMGTSGAYQVDLETMLLPAEQPGGRRNKRRGQRSGPDMHGALPSPYGSPTGGPEGFGAGVFYPPIDSSSVEALEDSARSQVEYYFTDENLVSDTFLRQFMDAEGYVPCAVIANFRRLQLICPHFAIFIQGIQKSTFLELDQENMKVRRRDGWEPWRLQQPDGSLGLPLHKLVAPEGAERADAAPAAALADTAAASPPRAAAPPSPGTSRLAATAKPFVPPGVAAGADA